jgi:hypothetical protein
MNYRSSYRKLLGDGKAALLAAIEIYNKPRIDYRDECFVILLLNAWELIVKAMLSKNQQSIFYPKLRHQPYRTYSLTDAFRKAEPFLPRRGEPCRCGLRRSGRPRQRVRVGNERNPHRTP